MGASHSAAPPAEAQHLGFDSGAALPEWGTDRNFDDDADSDVEYDTVAQSFPTPSHGRAREVDADSVMAADDGMAAAALPAWAAGGVADEPCTSRLALQFVYGIRGADCRRNVFFVPTGEVAFHAASLIVLYDPRRHTQRFLRGHDGEVRCLALHPRGTFLASGQAAAAARDMVWQLDESEPVMTLTVPTHEASRH